MAKHVQGVKDKIVAEIVQEDRVTDGGIVVPDTVNQLPHLTCLVVSVGNDVTTEVKKGVTIYCHRNAGMDILVNGKVMKILKDDEVYATVRQDVEGAKNG